MDSAFCKRWIAAAIVLAAMAPAVAGGRPRRGPGPAGPAEAACPHCTGQIVYRDVVAHRCKVVPKTKQVKKTVYEVKEVPLCLHKLPSLLGRHRQCCDECLTCGCVRYKKVLVKKEVVCDEICTSKCAIEEFVESVPCRVCAPDCPSFGRAIVPGPKPRPVVGVIGERAPVGHLP